MSQYKCSTLLISLQDVYIDTFLAKEGYVMWIYRPWFTTKDGVRIYARTYGKKVFRMWVDSEKE